MRATGSRHQPREGARQADQRSGGHGLVVMIRWLADDRSALVQRATGLAAEGGCAPSGRKAALEEELIGPVVDQLLRERRRVGVVDQRRQLLVAGVAPPLGFSGEIRVLLGAWVQMQTVDEEARTTLSRCREDRPWVHDRQHGSSRR